MKLRNEFITYPIDGNEVMIANGSSTFKGMVKTNPTASFIITCLKEETSEEEIVAKMFEKYDADPEILKKDVHHVIESLRKIGAIQE